MSELVTNKITPGTGSSDTVTLGDSGDTFTIPAGVTLAGSGASLTALPAANLTGTLPAISGASLTNLPTVPARGSIGGLRITNDGTDAAHDLGVAVGFARDYADAVNLSLTGALIKRIDASWAVGTNNGGLDTGSVGASALYGVYLIRRSDTGVVDVLFSLDTTAALATGTKPTNYDQWRLIGLCWTDGSSNLSPMLQTGDVFQKMDFVFDVDDGTISNMAWETATIRCPPFCVASLIGRHYNEGSSGGYGHSLDVQTKGGTKSATEQTTMLNVNGGGAAGGVVIDAVNGLIHIMVNSAKQIEYNSREQNGVAEIQLGISSVNMLTRSNP